MSIVTTLQHQLHQRKHNRERKRRLKQGRKAHREGVAIRKLRDRIKIAVARATAPKKMYDATSVGNIPKNARAVAGYVNGNYTTFPSLKSLFPRARRVSIAVTSHVKAEILDVEPGDATNADAARWFREQNPHRKPGFYTSASNANDLVKTLAAAGIKRSAYRLWTAHYTDKHICGPHTCGYLLEDADATQWTTHGETVDESVVKPSFWEGR